MCSFKIVEMASLGMRLALFSAISFLKEVFLSPGLSLASFLFFNSLSP